MKLLAGAALVAGAVGFGGGWYLRDRISDGDAAALRESALHAALIEQTRRLTAQEEAALHAAEQSRRARLDAAAAGRAADSLRGHVATLAQQCAATPAGSASGAGAGDVLADMLGRLEAAGRELAAEADRARAAGAACERSYDALIFEGGRR